MQPPNEVTPPEGADEKWAARFRKTLNLIGQFITQSAQEWVYSLLNQPTNPPFVYNANFDRELSRVVRLIVAVLFITSILVGGVNLLSKNTLLNFNEHVAKTFQNTLYIFIIALLVALIYTPVLFLSGVRICPQSDGEQKRSLKVGQVFFTVLYTFVPWLPIILFIKSSAIIMAQKGNIAVFYFSVFIAPLICFLYILVNLARSIKVLTNCNWTRIYLSLIVPALLLVLVFLILENPSNEALNNLDKETLTIQNER